MTTVTEMLKKAKEKGIAKNSVSESKPWHSEVDLSTDNTRQKGSINTIYKRDLSTGFINSVDQSDSLTGFNKGVDQRGLEKELINTVHKPLLKLIDLRSNPLSIIQYFYRLVVQNDGAVTRRVKMSEIMLELSISKDSARTALRFLLKNNLIKRVGYQIGKLGWSQYAIEENLFNELKEKGSINPVYDKGPNSSSSSINITAALEEQEIDFSQLSSIGFTRSHLAQILNQKKLTDEMIADSIGYFAFDLKYGGVTEKIKTDPLKYFMGILLKGEMYNRPANYESPQDIAMRQYLEAKKAERAKQEQMQNELLELHFEEWLIPLEESQIRAIVPLYDAAKGISTPRVKSELREYFRAEIWPGVKSKMI